jgi:hypothetical protein|tara:strand:- start:1037 stop:1345 length:309 start_codon:yes stop_codon:yes gene_type:complete
MNIKRLRDIIRCKKSRYTVTLRHGYKGQTQKEALTDFRLRIKVNKLNAKLKSFLNIMLAALIQLYIDAMQSLNLIDKTAHKPAEALLWAEIEPEAIPYISFL